MSNELQPIDKTWKNTSTQVEEEIGTFSSLAETNYIGLPFFNSKVIFREEDPIESEYYQKAPNEIATSHLKFWFDVTDESTITYGVVENGNTLQMRFDSLDDNEALPLYSIENKSKQDVTDNGWSNTTHLYEHLMPMYGKDGYRHAPKVTKRKSINGVGPLLDFTDDYANYPNQVDHYDTWRKIRDVNFIQGTYPYYQSYHTNLEFKIRRFLGELEDENELNSNFPEEDRLIGDAWFLRKNTNGSDLNRVFLWRPNGTYFRGYASSVDALEDLPDATSTSYFYLLEEAGEYEGVQYSVNELLRYTGSSGGKKQYVSLGDAYDYYDGTTASLYLYTHTGGTHLATFEDSVGTTLTFNEYRAHAKTNIDEASSRLVTSGNNFPASTTRPITMTWVINREENGQINIGRQGNFIKFLQWRQSNDLYWSIEKRDIATPLTYNQTLTIFNQGSAIGDDNVRHIPAFQKSGPMIITIRMTQPGTSNSKSSDELYINGKLIRTGLNLDIVGHNLQFAIQKLSTTIQNGFQLGEWVYYDKTLDQFELDSLHRYFSEKWKIPLDIDTNVYDVPLKFHWSQSGFERGGVTADWGKARPPSQGARKKASGTLSTVDYEYYAYDGRYPDREVMRQKVGTEAPAIKFTARDFGRGPNYHYMHIQTYDTDFMGTRLQISNHDWPSTADSWIDTRDPDYDNSPELPVDFYTKRVEHGTTLIMENRSVWGYGSARIEPNAVLIFDATVPNGSWTRSSAISNWVSGRNTIRPKIIEGSEYHDLITDGDPDGILTWTFFRNDPTATNFRGNGHVGWRHRFQNSFEIPRKIYLEYYTNTSTSLANYIKILAPKDMTLGEFTTEWNTYVNKLAEYYDAGTPGLINTWLAESGSLIYIEDQYDFTESAFRMKNYTKEQFFKHGRPITANSDSFQKALDLSYKNDPWFYNAEVVGDPTKTFGMLTATTRINKGDEPGEVKLPSTGNQIGDVFYIQTGNYGQVQTLEQSWRNENANDNDLTYTFGYGKYVSEITRDRFNPDLPNVIIFEHDDMAIWDGVDWINGGKYYDENNRKTLSFRYGNRKKQNRIVV